MEFSLREVDFPEGYVAVIDKPYEWTSADVVRKLKFQLRKCGYPKIKIGHAGTLDPLATGILLVCIGRATKQVEALQAEQINKVEKYRPDDAFTDAIKALYVFGAKVVRPKEIYVMKTAK